MIQEIKESILLPQIVDLAELIPETPKEKFKDMLYNGIAHDDTVIIVDKKDSTIKAFLFATMENYQGEEVAFIQLCYIHPEAPASGHEILNRLNIWAKKQGAKQLVFITKRKPRAYERKYHFEYAGKVLTKGVV